MPLYDVYTWILWVLLGIFCVGLLANLRFERRGTAAGLRGAVLRLVLCGIFSLAAFISGSMWRESFEIRSQIYFTSLGILAAGLLFCIPGDFFSAWHFRDDRSTSVSTVTLMASQILFLAAMTLTHLLDGWISALAIAAVLICLLIVLQRRGSWRGSSRPAAACMIVFALSAGKAGAGFFEDPEGTSLLLFAACLLFFAGGLLAGNPRRSIYVSTAFLAASMAAALSCGPLFA